MIALHIFFDKGGFFSSKSIEITEKIAPLTHYYYFQNKREKNDENIQIIDNENQIIELIKDGKISKVIFHSLHYFQFKLINRIRYAQPENQKVIVAWYFWSFEYYQLPFNVSSCYGKFSSQFNLRKRISIVYENLNHYFKGNVKSPFLLTKSNHANFIQSIDEFYSFIEDDYTTIFKDSTLKKFNFISYLSLSDLDNTISNDWTDESIMIGHNGSPLLNHYEVLQFLNKIQPDEKIVLPLNYGKKEYINKLKIKINNELKLDVVFLENRLPLSEYYGLLSSVSVFFLNSYFQQGLGNIVFFLLNGTSIYLSEKSSTYKTLINKGFIVFSIEEVYRNKSIRKMKDDEKVLNKNKIKSLISADEVEKQWKKLLS